MNLKKGSFDIDHSVSVTGVGKEMDKNSMSFSLAASGNYGDDQHIEHLRRRLEQRKITDVENFTHD